MSALTPTGSTTRWRTLRKHVLTRDHHTCQIQTPGICTTNATQVDHITPRSAGGTDHPTNLRAACAPCNLHRGNRTQPTTTNPTPTTTTNWDPTTPPTTRHVVLITGPPGSGKTTHANTLGLTHLEREQHQSDTAYIQAVTAAAATPDAHLAVIRCCETLAEQEHWRRLTGATHLVTMATPLDVCIRRIHARHRPGWRGEITAAKRWHATRATPPSATNTVASQVASTAQTTAPADPLPTTCTRW